MGMGTVRTQNAAVEYLTLEEEGDVVLGNSHGQYPRVGKCKSYWG
jgi:hypothetical protein